ncbi:MAG: hypothetical protein J6M94_05775 [Prevotella sp.]|nr:hypothetical protein [Prevotella sp.]
MAANIAVFRSLLKRVIVRRLQTNSIAGRFSLDVKCGILGCNVWHIGDQNAANCPPICGKQGTNMPLIASKEMVCEATMGCFRSPKATFFSFSACRMAEKADGVLSKYFVVF